jgi:hypothetical protein
MQIPVFDLGSSTIWVGADLSGLSIQMSWFLQAFAKLTLGHEFQLGAFSPFDLYVS